MLRTQYEALMKEIDEKSKMMDEQIVQKESASGTIETEMSKKISEQDEEIKKQITVYIEQTALKQNEEKELVKVLTDYKQKHEEFSKAMKKSRETFRMYEGEIKNLTSRANELTLMKKKLMGMNPHPQASGGGKKGKQHKVEQQVVADSNPYSEEAYEKMQSEWNAEKEMLNKEKEELMQMCKEMQDQIKIITDSKK
jgi:hypothetical protein